MKKPLLSALLIILLILLLSSCTSKNLDQSTETKPLTGKWFTLRQGYFESSEAPGSLIIPPQPWTVQNRVAALSALDHKVFLAVNGRGIVSLDITSLSDPHFEYFYDPLIFQNRTITSLFPDKNTLLCHLYFNTLLNTVKQEDLKIQGISLIKLFPNDSIYRFIIPPFQRQNPEWESVNFLLKNQDEFIFEWKHSSPEETLFNYTMLNYREQKEESVDRLLFQDSFAFRSVNDLKEPPPLVLLIDEVKNSLVPTGHENTLIALHFLLKEGNSGVRKRYEYYPPGFSSGRHLELYTVNLIKHGENFFALLPEGILLKTDQEKKDIDTLNLPSMPENIIFTDFYIEDNFLVAAWEEVHFIDVGAAGIFISDISFWH